MCHSKHGSQGTEIITLELLLMLMVKTKSPPYPMCNITSLCFVRSYLPYVLLNDLVDSKILFSMTIKVHIAYHF